MNDPTYSKALIQKNPEWELAYSLSEIMNDNAPIGWAKYVYPARCLLSLYEVTRRGEEVL